MNVLQLNDVTQQMLEQLKPFEVTSEQALVLTRREATKEACSFAFEFKKVPHRILKWRHFEYEGASLSQKGKNGLVFGCFDEACCKGLLSLMVMPWKKSLHITHLFIQQSARNKGYGRVLLEYAKQVGKEKGLCFLSVEVQSGNGTAVQYYQRMGFEIVGFESGRYNAMPEFEEDIAIFMRKRLE